MQPGSPFQSPQSGDPEQALRDSEARLQQVLDNTSAAVFAKDRNGRYLFVNREFERLVGLDAASLIGRTDRDIFPPDLAAGFRRNDMRVLLEARPLEFEEAGVFAGAPRTFLSAKFPLFDSQQVPYAVCGISTDITHRKQIETALSASALAVSTACGRELFVELSRYLAAILAVDVAFIAEIREDVPDTMRMLSFVHDGAPRENFEYALTGTACETVVGHGFRIYPAALGQQFPLDDDFKALGAESYAGYPLTDTQGSPLGLISIVSSHPLEQAEFIESVMKIFAVRAAAELERIRADAALLASQASYRQIFEASEDAIFVHDYDSGRIVDVNPKACAIYGYDYDEFLSVPMDGLGSGERPYTGADAAAHLQRARELGSTGFEWRRRNKDGSLHWDEVFLKAANIGGQPRILAFTREITERKLAEEAAERNAEHLKATVNAALDCIIAMDESGVIIKFNPAAEACFGISQAQALGRPLADVIIPERLRDQHRQGLERYLAGGPGPVLQRRVEVTGMRADGSEFPAELAVGVDHSPSGKIFIGYLRDITDRIESDERRRRLETQLQQAKKMEAIGHLTGGIAHDFNNLLASIMGYVVLASERPVTAGDERLQAHLDKALRSCERARDLIRQMLMFSRGQKGTPQPVDAAESLEQNLGMLRPTIPDGIRIANETSGDVPLVAIDPVQLDQVIANLCVNACDAMQDGGTLRVSAARTSIEGRFCSACRQPVLGEFVELRVQDDGPGIEAAILERIFDPFFSTKPSGKGTGMGLATVHGIVHEHGGHLLVDSAPGQGSCFRVLLPVCRDQAPASREAERAAMAPLQLSGRVLVVDDEHSVGEFMCELLDGWGLQADFTASPADALERVRAEPGRYQLLISDHAMPGITGVDLARALAGAAPELPILLYSGLTDRIGPDALAHTQVRGVLQKPVDRHHLGRMLVQLLQEPPERMAGGA
ncbi:PAS domain-containing hybrid sensor histidine kinase/response regulator [Lysobacter niastensis]|uniref:histidine kinase n=1 Tax=Lysobacter niastensis TaxID=380629 RepID=A0ABS0B7K8_9GAMM|nr:PAS domain S-box protein [Lysobacter niastensis]MBF6023707.1 PAS domain S-box protein [Lysobacter niastensis]